MGSRWLNTASSSSWRHTPMVRGGAVVALLPNLPPRRTCIERPLHAPFGVCLLHTLRLIPVRWFPLSTKGAKPPASILAGSNTLSSDSASRPSGRVIWSTESDVSVSTAIGFGLPGTTQDTPHLVFINELPRSTPLLTTAQLLAPHC